ncbi:hypothetical protein PSQ90_13440 [Devosia rhodophyticola]|uniref:Tetracyclin repressor SlmA-like C-terminal domain-containing protein n=1 Tax=Devosia rhodophyticola TaxID=3026423 RepID=A0ABY7YVJ4_9HYPH|nr:hypothetical protein [Devosia rhodophyticola]WDR05284.1 hypothetical protein PSQ90_13440 [Devosia rhodophyticola]
MATVVDYYGEAFIERFAEAIAAMPGDTLAEAVDTLVDMAFDDHPQEPKLRRILIWIAPRVGRAEHRRALSVQVAGFVEDVLRQHRAALASDLALKDAATMREAVLETAAHRAIEDHPSSIAPGRLAIQCKV